MKYYRFFICCLFLVAIGICGCSSNDGAESTMEYYDGMKAKLVSKESLPGWVKEKINSLEKDDTYFLLKTGKYKGETFYWFDISASSCPFCDLYNQQGEWFNKTEKYTMDDISQLSSRSLWTIIYAYPSLDELHNYYGS